MGRGADVNIKTEEGVTAMMWAASMGHVDIVKYLHQAGANINIKNMWGDSALDLAAELGHSAVVQYLTQANGWLL